MSKGIKIEGHEGKWEIAEHEQNAMGIYLQFCVTDGERSPGEFLLLRRLPDPKRMPELKPGMLVRSDLGTCVVLCDKYHNETRPCWNCWDSKSYSRIIYVDTIFEIFDHNRISIWKREE